MPGLVGAYIDTTGFNPTGHTLAQDITSWQTYLSRTLTVRRVYFAAGSIPTSITSDLSADVTAGRKACISFKPAYNPVSSSDRTKLSSFLTSCHTAGLVADVALWHEPYTQSLSQSQYQAMINYYGPTVRALYPLVYSRANYAVANHNQDSYYMSGSFDKSAVDFYCVDYNGGVRLTTAQATTDPDGLPFGIWEFNYDANTQTQTQCTTFFNYLLAQMQARLTAGKPNADVLFFNQNVLNARPPVAPSGDFRVPLLQGMFDSLNNNAATSVTGPVASSTAVFKAGSTAFATNITGQPGISSTLMVPGQPPQVLPVVPVPAPSAIVPSSAPQYTFITTDLVTNNILGEIPVTGVTLDCQLNTPGNMTSTANLNNPLITDDDFIARTIPGRTAFWAYRDSKIVWGGIIWTRQWEAKGKVFSFTGQTFESYASRVRPFDWIGLQQKTYIENQCQIITALWRGLQSIPSANIGVIVPSDSTLNPVDVSRTLTVNGWDLSTSFNDVIQSIVQFDDGPDYTIMWATDNNGLPTKTLAVAPRLGNPVSSTDLIIDYPGSIQDYFYTEDAASGNNRWYAVGSGSGTSTPTGVATDSDSLIAGWPLLVGVNSFSDTIDDSTLASRAASDLKAQGMPLVVHGVDMTGSVLPPFGSYSMGDHLNANVSDPRFPQGQTFSVRVIGWSIAPPDTGNGVETITLVFDEPTGSLGSGGA